MNHKNETTYGRKIIKGTRKQKSEYCKKLYASWNVCFLIGLIIGVILFWGFSFLFKDKPIETPKSTDETISKSTVEITSTAMLEDNIISVGEYKLTAYCSCEKCCGYWASIRPLDENGKPIVYTANNSVAKQGVTVAADTNVLPFGTVLLIDGHEYIVQDRGGAIKGNSIDVYFESHEEALQFGVQYKEIFLKGDKH